MVITIYDEYAFWEPFERFYLRMKLIATLRAVLLKLELQIGRR